MADGEIDDDRDERNPVAELADYAMEFVDRLREEHGDHFELGELAIVAEVVVTDDDDEELFRTVDGLGSCDSRWAQIGLLNAAVKSIDASDQLSRFGPDDDDD